MAEPLNIPPVPVPVPMVPRLAMSTVHEVADPDGREAIVVSIEWNQVATTDDGNVWRDGVVTLKIGQTDEVSVIIAGLVAAFGRECLLQYGARLDEKMLTDGCCEQGLDQGGIGRLTCIGIREEADTAREQRSILSGPVSHGGEHGQSQEKELRRPCQSRASEFD